MKVSILVSLISTYLLGQAWGNVIGLDFGSDAMKVALVQPGSPLEIVTNFQSKRKTPTCLTFYRGERMFGSDSYALMPRKPELTVAKAYRMLGREVSHPLVKEVLSQYFPHEIYTNETTGVTTMKMEDTYYTPEELIAMMMQHAKDMTLNFGGKVIKDCVITVPSSFTQHERRALYTAADIAELKVLSLIEENTAAALHYGIDRVFEEPNTVLYYNMGASAVQVSIATYSSYQIKEAGKNKSIGQFEVVGKAWDASLGGFAFDVRLAEMLAERFNLGWNKKASGKGKDLKDFVRPMTRLRVEANKVKEVLSANQEYPVKAEQLHDNTDLNTKITRSEFEAACEDMFARLTAPIDQALTMAGLTLDKVHSVEMLGGGVRMPRVKKILDEYFKTSKLELGQHMNGDEAMALGAAFRAANLSTAFRVRKVGVQDVSTFGVSVRLESLPEAEKKESGGLFGGLLGGKKKEEKGDSAEDAEAWVKQTTVYPAKSAIPSKPKTVAFNYDKDILCKIEYDDSVPLPVGTTKTLGVFNITGIADFAKESNAKGLGSPKVHLSFSLDGSGVVFLSKAEATYELPPEPEPEPELGQESTPEGEAKDKVEEEDSSSSGTEEGKKEGSDGKTEGASEGETKEGEAKEGENKEGEDKEKDKKKADKKDKKKKEKKPKKVKRESTVRRVLSVSEDHHAVSPPAWTPMMVAEARGRLRALQAADQARQAREAALNDLEGYIYKVKNRLSEEEELKKASTEEQRQDVLTLSSTTEEWLYDDGRSADVNAFLAKHADIKTKAEAIFTRYKELTDRPAAVKVALENLLGVKTSVAAWTEKLPQVTEEEKTHLLGLVEKAEAWIADKEALQAAKAAHEEPVYTSYDVPLQLKSIGQMFERLLRKPKPPPPVVKIEDNNSTNANTTTTDNNGTTTIPTTDAAGGETPEVKIIPDAAASSTTEGTAASDAETKPSKDEF